jgi:hypothetical protein
LILVDVLALARPMPTFGLAALDSLNAVPKVLFDDPQVRGVDDDPVLDRARRYSRLPVSGFLIELFVFQMIFPM